VLIKKIADTQDNPDTHPERRKDVSRGDENHHEQHGPTNPWILEESILLRRQTRGEMATTQIQYEHTQADEVGVCIYPTDSGVYWI